MNSRFLNNQAYLPEKQPYRLELLVSICCQELHYLFCFEWVFFSVASIYNTPGNISPGI
jgi:hypothetical protein